MPVTKEEVLDSILAAIEERLAQAQDDGQGGIDEATRKEVERLKGLTEEPALTKLMVHLSKGGSVQLSLDRPKKEPTLVDLLVDRGVNGAKPAIAKLLKRARRMAAKKFPPRS